MRKNSLITAASMLSLVLGVLSSFLIFLWVESEITTDQFHKNYDNIYIPIMEQPISGIVQPLDMGSLFNINYSQFPEIDKVVNILVLRPERTAIEYNNIDYRTLGIVTDSLFFDILDFRLKIVNKTQVLKNPNSIILTESFAEKIFNDKDPIGETIKVGQYGLFQIEAILEDIPSNSTIQFDYIIPKHAQEVWAMGGIELILANSSFDQTIFSKKISDIGKKNRQFSGITFSVSPFSANYFEQPIDSILFSKVGNPSDIQTMLLVAFIILVISCLNFTNMQITLLYSQAVSFGIKKVYGLRKIDYLLEIAYSRTTYMLIGTAITFGLFQLIKLKFAAFLNLTLDFLWYQELAIITLGCTLFIIIASTVSFFQSIRLQTTSLIERTIESKKNHVSSILTTIQYNLSITLIIATGVVYKQFKFMQTKELGFNSSNVISAQVFDMVTFKGNYDNFREESRNQQQKYESFKTEISAIPGLVGFTQSRLPMSKYISDYSWKLHNSDFEFEDINMLLADPGLLPTLELEMIEGRFFSHSFDHYNSKGVIINESAKEHWGINNIEQAELIGKGGLLGTNQPQEIIGVVKDFHYEHLSRKIEPLVLVLNSSTADAEFTFKLNEINFQETLGELTTVFQGLYPRKALAYTFLEDIIDKQYQAEKKLSQTFLLFTLVALTLSSIGLFTFALHNTQRRIKEIGIRKSIGATTYQIIKLLGGNFLKWVILAFVIALPISWFAMNEWLSNFAHKTELSWWIFVGTGILVLSLALITVIGQSYSAANQNLVNALRHE